MGGARGGEVRDGRGTARIAVVATAVLAALTAGPKTAAAFDARLRWLPVPGVAGYRLYVRQSGRVYGSGVDVGPLQLAPMASSVMCPAACRAGWSTTLP